MTAKEMFENLGYHEYTIYEKTDKRFGYQKIVSYYPEVIRNIHFNKRNKTINIFGRHITDSLSVWENEWLTIEEYQAITQQMKELGWIE